jgi:hypothetical protein
VEQTPGLIEKIETMVGSNSGKPKVNVVIKDCGEHIA